MHDAPEPVAVISRYRHMRERVSVGRFHHLVPAAFMLAARRDPGGNSWRKRIDRGIDGRIGRHPCRVQHENSARPVPRHPEALGRTCTLEPGHDFPAADHRGLHWFAGPRGLWFLPAAGFCTADAAKIIPRIERVSVHAHAATRGRPIRLRTLWHIDRDIGENKSALAPVAHGQAEDLILGTALPAIRADLLTHDPPVPRRGDASSVVMTW